MKTLSLAISMVLKKLHMLPVGQVLLLCLLGCLSISGAHSQQKTQVVVPPKIDARFSNGFGTEKGSADLWLKELENTMLFVEKEDLSLISIDEAFGTRFLAGATKLVEHPLGASIKVRFSQSSAKLAAPYLNRCKPQQTVSSLAVQIRGTAENFNREASFPLLAPSFDGTVRLMKTSSNSVAPTYLFLPLNFTNYFASVRTSPWPNVHFYDGDDDFNILSNRFESTQLIAVYRRETLDRLLQNRTDWKLLPNQTGQLLINKFNVDSLASAAPKSNATRNQTIEKPLALREGKERLLIDEKYKHYEIVYQGKKGIWRISDSEAIADRTVFDKDVNPNFQQRCVERVIAFQPKPPQAVVVVEEPLEKALLRLLVERKPTLTATELGGKDGIKLMETLPINGASGMMQFALSHPELEPPTTIGFGPSTLIVHSPCLSSWNKRQLGTHWTGISGALKKQNCNAFQRMTVVFVPRLTDSKGCIKESEFIGKLNSSQRMNFRPGSGYWGGLLKHRFGTFLIDEAGVAYTSKSTAKIPEGFSEQELSKDFNAKDARETNAFIRHIKWVYSERITTAYFQNQCLVRLDHHGEFANFRHQKRLTDHSIRTTFHAKR
jgi:hypothetical protein